MRENVGRNYRQDRDWESDIKEDVHTVCFVFEVNFSLRKDKLRGKRFLGRFISGLENIF